MITTGHAITVIRNSLSMTPAVFATKAAISRSLLRRLEEGTPPNELTRLLGIRIAAQFGLSLTELLATAERTGDTKT